jgi:hypothetical protein
MIKHVAVAASLFLLLQLKAFSNYHTDTTNVPPATWQEHWFEHKQLLTRVYYDKDVAVYYDDDMDRNVTWPIRKLEATWQYVRKVYGHFGKEDRLYIILHAKKYGGGHPATYFDESHDFRNVIDVGQAGDWKDSSSWNLDATVHEIGHIVEGGSKGVHGSPAFDIWHDSKWIEIFQYDVYLSLGWKSEAERFYNKMMVNKDNFPVAGAQWFKNWFYPIYNEHGKAAVLNNFFTLLAKYYPQKDGAYVGGMNWGEFVLFWSGAAHTDLQPLAKAAFVWPNEVQQQWEKARKDFPQIKY